MTMAPPRRPLPQRLPYPDIVAVYDMTEQEYLHWDQEGGLADWIDGKVYQYMSASDAHQEIVEFLVSFIRALFQVTGTARLKTGPYAMRTRPGRTWREPDLVLTRVDVEDRIGISGLAGPGELVMEVVSPGSRKRDLEDVGAQ